MNELSITQPEGAHRVTVVLDGGNYLVRCTECERLFRISTHGAYEILVRGDMMASHCFGPGGVVIGGLKIRTEGDSDIERLLDDVDIDVGDL